MSTNSKVIIGIVVVIVLAVGLWWWNSTMSAVSPTQPTTADQTKTQTQTQTQPSDQAAATSSGDVTAQGNSNAALQNDAAGIDSQMNGFSSDNANVNQGMNDQPVQQQQL